MVAVISFFRNSESRGQLSRFLAQVAELQRGLKDDGYNMRLIAVEGDSVDDTKAKLVERCSRARIPLTLVDGSHGLREFGSTEEPDRLEALSQLGNKGLSEVDVHDDSVVYVESDLLWSPTTIRALHRQLKHGVDIISPLVFAGEHFYDVFCYRNLQGARFSPFPPYSDALVGRQVAAVGSVGSCLVMKADVARTCRIPGAEVLIGFCRVAREKGFNIFVDARERIYHP